MMVGLPGSGKDTWIKNNNHEQLPILSTDKWIEEEAYRRGLTYNEIFKDYIKVADNFFKLQLIDVIVNKKSFIWNQTNLSKKSRKGKIDKIKDTHRIIAVPLDPAFTIIKQRNEERKRYGRSLPDELLITMNLSYESPTFDEGFTEIYND